MQELNKAIDDIRSKGELFTNSKFELFILSPPYVHSKIL